METTYIETTIVSYLVARPSRNLVMAARHEITRRWWNEERSKYHCVTSNEVLREASQGDVKMIGLRLAALSEVAVILVPPKALALASDILRESILPPAVLSDAIHAATAAIHGADILLTWNCRHLANPHLLPRLRAFMGRHGLNLPEVCTPMELVGE